MRPLADIAEDPAFATAFAGRATIGAPAAARLLDMDIDTLQRHVAAGHLVARIKGLGQVRRHRVFTRGDLLRFLQAQADAPPIEQESKPCPSIATSAARTGNSTFSAVVLGFPDRPGSKTNITRRPSKMRKSKKPTS